MSSNQIHILCDSKLEMCMGMGNARFPSLRRIPIGMGTKLLKLIGMRRE